ncbi:Claudin domain-containing protein 2 [Plecturocebus cupreus]
MGVKRSLQSGGILLSLLANVFMVLSTATNYWTRQHEGHSGLWQECKHGICSNILCQSEEARPALMSDGTSDPRAPDTQLGPRQGARPFHLMLRCSCPSSTEAATNPAPRLVGLSPTLFPSR